MAENTNPGESQGHKRSKSSLASILHLDRSKEDKSDDQHRAAIGESSTLSASAYSTNPRHQIDEIDSPSISHGAAGMTIEQSVRVFKVFEVLRAGDKDAVARAITESSEGKLALEGTTILHLAIQCAEPLVVNQVLSAATAQKIDINDQDRDGNTPLHLASVLGRTDLVRLLLSQDGIDSSVQNYQGRLALDLAKTPDIFQQLQLDRTLFTETQIKAVQTSAHQGDYEGLEKLLEDPKVTAVLDVNTPELATEPETVQTGGTLMHEAARRKDIKLIQLLLLNGADPFRRDRKGKLPQDVTKDDRTRAILKKSPAATAAQRGIQEKAILGGFTTDGSTGGKDSREMKGYLKKWTNYTSGYKLRWFVLEDGVLSYYKHQDDAGSACRGAMNMRIAKLSMDAQDKTRFEIQGKSSIKYHLKAGHSSEAKRWFWSLNNAIQWAKDEAREESHRKAQESNATQQALSEHKARVQHPGASTDHLSPGDSQKLGGKGLVPATAIGIPSNNPSKVSFRTPVSVSGSVAGDDIGSVYGSYDANDLTRITSVANTTTLAGDDDDDEYGDDASSHDLRPVPKDAFAIIAHSAKLQLDLLGQVGSALQKQAANKPDTTLSDPTVSQAVDTYESAVSSLKSMVGDLLKISRDRDTYWQYRVDREVNMRRLWEDSMAKVAQEQEELEGRIGESEEKRKRTKRALRDALEESAGVGQSRPENRAIPEVQEETPTLSKDKADVEEKRPKTDRAPSIPLGIRRKSTIAAFTDLSDSDSEGDEEFFDAVGAGEVAVGAFPVSPLSTVTSPKPETPGESDIYSTKTDELSSSFRGYEDPVRKRLKMDADDRPKISLWGILKSMIGKDMTKMTLPVSFNEPTSLLQRVAEDMEYAALLDTVADRQDSTERMVYVATFAASEYASTIGRVAKPFNPLLGETYEYARPDKGYRFFIEQVSHHPPIGAAWAESPKWDYYGESAVKSKFYGKSFDINPLGTWFLKLRPVSGGEELYTWKKVTSSVIGIITGSPTVDNYGLMEVKNWTTGETCVLDFKARGWKASSAYQVSGKVTGADGNTRWSVGGRWNDKIYARFTPGFEASMDNASSSLKAYEPGSSQAFLVWEANKRPTGIPFNLTPFVVTLNAVPDNLRKILPPTDTRLRPDQRAMEDGEYDFAATEKNRVEEKQRATRREREANGEEFVPRWFTKGKCKTTGEEYWVTNGEYWKMREQVSKGGKWEDVEDIF